jgi:hypothetical protein
MTKLSLDLDFTKSPEEVFAEIKKRTEQEYKKFHTKKKVDVFLSQLHEIVNEHTGLRLSGTNDLIRALTPHSTPALQDKLSRTSPTGRRKTISMTKELFEQISGLLNAKNSNKAKIARRTGVSVVQVRKIASGGYDKKYGTKVRSNRPAEPPSQDVQTDLLIKAPVETPTEEEKPEEPPMHQQIKSPLDL